MKRMEKQIAITYAIMFVVGFIINWLYSVISMDSNFFNLEVASSAIWVAFIYLIYVWLFTRKSFPLAFIGLLSVILIAAINDIPYYGIATQIMQGFHWNTTILFICVSLSVLITLVKT